MPRSFSGWVGIERSVLVLHRSAAACRRPTGEALRDESARAHGASGGEQVVGALRTQSVRGFEEAVDVAHVEVPRQRRELMHDHLGFGRRHRLGDRVGVESVGHDRARSQAADQVLLRCAPGHPDHLVPSRYELRDELSAENACRAGHEDPHNCSFRLFPSETRLRGPL